MAYEDDDSRNDDPGHTVDEAAGLPRDERAFIIPARDVRGDSVRLYCRAQPAVARLLADIQASHKYPFRTMGDVIRWCVVVGARRLAAGHAIDSVVTHIEAATAVLADEEFQIQFREYFNRLRAVVDHFVEARANGEARRCISEARGRFMLMPAGYWRDRYMAELMDRYGKLLDGDGTSIDLEGETAGV